MVRQAAGRAATPSGGAGRAPRGAPVAAPAGPVQPHQRRWRPAGRRRDGPLPATPGGPSGATLGPDRRPGAALRSSCSAFLGGLVSLITDLWWYGALGRTSILTTRLWSQVGLFIVGFLAFAVPALASIWVARRIAPQVPIRRIGQFEVPDASRAITWALVGVVGLLSLVSAGAWSGSWQTILLFVNGGDFGTTDPNFQRDIGFYVFDLPFWRFLQGWAIHQPDRHPAVEPRRLCGGRAALAVPPDRAGARPPLDPWSAAAGQHRRRLPARHPGAELLDQRLRVDPGGDLHRHERPAAGVPDPHLRRAGGGRAAAAEHLVPHAVGAGAGRRRMVRAVDPGGRAVSGLRAELPGQPERADRRATVYRRATSAPPEPPSTWTPSSCATSAASRT